MKGFGGALNTQVGGSVRSTGKSLGAVFGKMFVLGSAVIAAAGVSNFLKGSIDEAREAQKVGAATKQIIKATGGAAKITAAQVGDLTTAISNKAGVDDEAIQTGANLLLTFKNVRNEAGKGADIFDRATQSAVDLSAAGFGSIDSASKMLGKALNDPIKGISALSRAGVTFTDQQKEQIKTLVESGDVLSAQKIILGEVEGQVGGVAEATATSGEKARVAFGNIKEAVGTALLPAIDDLAGGFVKIAPAIQEGLAGVGPAFDTVKGLVKDAIGVISGLVGDIHFGRFVEPLVDGLKSAKRNATKLADSLGNLGSGDFEPKELGEKIGNALATAIEKLISLSGKVAKALAKMFSKVDWVGLGITIGKYVPAMLLGLAVGILNFDPEPIFQGIKDHWLEVLIAVLTLAFAPTKLIGPLEKILTKIPFVGRFLAVAVRWLNDLGGKLASFGSDLFKAMWRGFTGGRALPGARVVAKVLGALKSLPGKVADFFVRLQVRIGVYALDAFEAIGRGARKALVSVLGFVRSIPGRILSALGSLIRLLSPRGADLIEGLLKAIRDKAKAVFAFVKAIPGKIKSAVGRTSSLLYSAGADIVRGLINGIKSMAKAAADAAISVVKGALDKAKGFLHIKSPSKVFDLEVGRMISLGMANGIRARSKDVTDAIGEVAKKASKKAKEKIAKLRDELSQITQDFQGLADPISSNFTQGLFDFTNASSFISNLKLKQITLSGLIGNFNKLKAEGLSPGFLYKLFESGGPDLIASLASLSGDDARAAGNLFADVTSLSDQLGATVAGGTQQGAALLAEQKATNDKLEKLVKTGYDNAKMIADAITQPAKRARRRAVLAA